MADLAREIEEAVLAIDSVTGLYGTGSTVINALGKAGGAAHRVTVEETATATTVTLSIGADGAVPATETADAVNAVIHSLLLASEVPAPVVLLTVAHVGTVPRA